MKKLLIIISACNEAASLEVFLPKLWKVVNTLALQTTILLVDDGSTDETTKVAKENNCLVVSNSQNLGIGKSLRIGYKKAIDDNFDITITMDADGQHDPSLLPQMTEMILSENYDVVVASRYHKDSERFGVPLDRDLLNISVTAQIRVVTGWNVTDPLTGFWAMTREYFKFALENGRQERYGIHLENLIKFWFLCEKRPRHIEIPHPAIYDNHGTHSLLTRVYSTANQEDRLHRFGTHALHIIEAVNDVKIIKGDSFISDEIEKRKR